MPLWELAPKLTNLGLTSYHFHERRLWEQTKFVSTDELNKETLTSFELPTNPFVGTAKEAEALTFSIAFRTVVAAALGGQLRNLSLPKEAVQQPFAVRELLPFWVGVEFDFQELSGLRVHLNRWYEAAEIPATSTLSLVP